MLRDFCHGCDDTETSLRQAVGGVLRLSRSFLSQNSRSTDAMGRPKKPIERRSNGVYCVQLQLDSRFVMRSLEAKEIEVAHRRAGQAMAELEAENKAKQQGRSGGERQVRSPT